MDVTLVRACAAACLWAALTHPALADDIAARDELPPGQLTFRVFAGADGLRNLVINSISQDGQGLLWVGTEDGAYRFDGQRFTQFTAAEGLPSNRVLVAGVGPAGEECLGGSMGMACWDGARFSQARTRGLPTVGVQAIVSFGGKLWVGTQGAGLYVRDANGVFVPAPGWRGASDVRVLWADDAGLIVGDGATVQLSSGDGTWRRLDHAGVEGRDPVDGVLRDHDGALWIRTALHLWFLPRGAARATDVREGLPAGYAVAGVPTGMVIGPRGNVLVGSDLGIAAREGGRWRILDRTVGVSAASNRTLFVDREGSLWIGTTGLAQLRGRGLIERYDVATGMAGDDLWGFQRDANGTLWAGTNRCLARAVGGRWECMRGTENRTVRAFAFAPQGGVFVGGLPSELLYVDPAGHVTSLGSAGRSSDRMILALAIGPGGDLFIATEGGVDVLPGAVPGRIEHVTIPGRKKPGRFASLLVVGQQVWTSDEQGIAMLEHGTWHLFDKSHGFLDSAMRYLIHRADGRLCVAYDEPVGVTCFRYADGNVSSFEHIGVANGLAAGMVYFLGEDHQGRLWLGTGAGVDVVTAGGIDHFDQSDGLAGDDSTANAFLADRDGSLWFGATGGASHLFAQYYRGPLAAPRATLLDGRVGDESILGRREAIAVPHDRNTLSLEFASTSLLDAKHIEYQVRLWPMEVDWLAARERHTRYPALPPGSYRFEARARIGGGAWGPGTELRFSVLPPWWQTRWFFLLVATAGLLALALGFTWLQRAVLRRRTRQLNQRNDESFRSVIDLMPDLIAVYRDRDLSYLNVASRRFLGLEPGVRWSHRQLFQAVHHDDRRQLLELLRKVDELAPQQASDVVELQLRSADRTWRSCELSALRVEIAGALTMVVSGRDITERKRMRAKLLVSDRMASLGTLAAGIAHEINNPLAYVTGNLEALAEALQLAKRSTQPADCEELGVVVSDARDGAERVRKIVHGLRSFSRSKDHEQRTSLAIGDVLEAAFRLAGNEIRHRAQLVRALGPVPRVMADDGRLTQVFINLLVNASQAIPEGHSDDNRITVRTYTDGLGRAVIEVEDTGEGMAPEVQSRVFDPFFTTKDVGEGTGLGLSICHGIISGLGGQISIDSAPGRGTVVRIALPPHAGDDTAEAAPAEVVELATSSAGQRRHRVLLVDDEPQVAHTMERLLRRDYDITVALCGKDAIDHIMRGARFDANVSDVMMPNMTGIELTEELLRVAPDQAQRLIFLSGGAFTAQTHDRLHALGAPQLEKPVTAKELRACVQRVVSEVRPVAA